MNSRNKDEIDDGKWTEDEARYFFRITCLGIIVAVIQYCIFP